MNIKEEFRDIPGFEQYQVSNLGRVLSKGNHARRKEKILKPGGNRLGYHTYTFRKEGKNYHRQAHRVVLETFIGSCPSGMECRHLDGNPSNNCLWNLKWGTSKENKQDQLLHGTAPRGEKHGRAKITKEIAAEIRKKHNTSQYSHRELGRMFGLDHSHITRILLGAYW